MPPLYGPLSLRRRVWAAFRPANAADRPNGPGRLIAGTPWLDVFCPGCGTSRAIDLREVDRHPLASVATLVLGLRCSWCPESAPMPRILGLHALPPAAKAAASNL